MNVADTEHQGEWQEILESARIDPELFSYQVSMNQREGGADELFRFAEAEDFIDFLLALALDPALGDRVGKNIAAFQRELLQRKRAPRSRARPGGRPDHADGSRPRHPRVRGRSRGFSSRASSVLILDNPIGRASRPRFLELQRDVARAMGVQLIYTTGVNDHEALRALPNIIRLRNERVDRNTGRRLVEHMPDETSIIEAVRIGRRENVPDSGQLDRLP